MHTYDKIGTDEFAVAVSGRVLGYISRRLIPSGPTHWSLRFRKDGEWMGRYETRREAREALMLACSMKVV